jgi:hypothetical protein
MTKDRCAPEPSPLWYAPQGQLPVPESFGSTIRDWKKKKRRNIELGSGFGRFLAVKIEFSYGEGQTVKTHKKGKILTLAA